MHIAKKKLELMGVIEDYFYMHDKNKVGDKFKISFTKNQLNQLFYNVIDAIDKEGEFTNDNYEKELNEIRSKLTMAETEYHNGNWNKLNDIIILENKEKELKSKHNAQITGNKQVKGDLLFTNNFNKKLIKN